MRERVDWNEHSLCLLDVSPCDRLYGDVGLSDASDLKENLK